MIGIKIRNPTSKMTKDTNWLLFYNGTGIEMPFKFNSKNKLILKFKN